MSSAAATDDLEQFAADAVKRALAGGATDAECTISEGEEFSVSVRMREVESLKEAGSRGAGIRVLVGQADADRPTPPICRPKESRRWCAAALELAKITSEDPHAGIAGPRRSGQARPATCSLYDDAIARWTREWKIEQAKRAEDAAFSVDPRIQNSEGASFDSYLGRRVFANSRGFVGSYRTSSCGLERVAGREAGRVHGARLLVLRRRARRPSSRARKRSAGTRRNARCGG